MNNSSSNLIPPTGQKEKFELEQQTLPADLGTGLPESYGDNRLVAMARDPLWFFCYWEFTQDRLAPVRASAGPQVWDFSALVLRVYDVTDRANQTLDSCPFIDVEVDKQARSWYVKVERSGRSYQIELGLRLPDGRFFAFLNSNRIAMPFGRVSDQIDTKFMAVSVGIVQEEWQKFQDIAGNMSSMGKGSAEFARMMAVRWEFLRSIFSGSSSWVQAPSSWPSGSAQMSSGALTSGEKRP